MDLYKDIVSLENLALAAAAEDRYEDALRAHSQALEMAKNMNRPRLMAVLFERVGWVLEVKGEIQQAVIAYESGVKALASKEELNLKKVLRSLGAVSKGFDSQREPVPDLYSEAIAHDLKTAEASPTLAVSLLINIGNVYFRQPQEEPALNAYQEALQRPEIAQAPRLRAYALANIGEIRRRRGEIDAAAEALDEAMALFEMHANPLEKRRALALLAGIARDRGKIEEALNSYQQALKLYADANDPLGEGRTHAGLGRLLLSQGRFADAQKSYQQAQKLAKQENDKETLWHVYWGLGRCYREAKEFNKALRSFRKSLSLIEARTDSLRTDEGKVTFLDSVQDVFDQLIGVYLEYAQLNAQSRYKQALRVAEDARARALRALMGGRERQRPSLGSRIRSSRRRPFAEQYQSYVELANDISSDWQHMAAQMVPSTPSASDSGLLANRSFDNFSKLAPGTLSASKNDILANHLFENSSRLAQGTRSRSSTDRSTDEPSADLAPTTVELPPLARLVFHLLPDQTAIFAVRPDGSVQGHVAELGRQTLTERIEQLRQALGIDEELRGMDVDVELTRHSRRSGGTAASEATSLLRQLYSDLIAPIADWLPTDGTPVVIEPHGALWLLPFAALKLADGTWLIDKWPLLYAPSAGVLDEIRKEADYGEPSTLKALIAGNPTMPKVPTQNGLQITLQPLPGAEKEAEEIAALFPPERHTLLLGANADLATIKKQATQHGILHLATHGIAYAEDPYASFLALAASQEDNGDNGLLTARDAIGLPLPADLVVLSACQTGLGHISGDGMIGLSRAFLVAGARAVLVSQWSVSDSATAALMTLFYRSYITLDNKAHALQLAMQRVRAMPEYKDPRYWASFVVVGAEA